ncbi:microaggregate-binding protein 1 [Nocardia miyunensis]|uniref:microaggregate-binding protein 1 n=1 Tax=Nocardia miyunensis TaxID=282684 RepID=UPI0008346ABA|nr:CsbD family protein [Nocardia miyunensis]
MSEHEKTSVREGLEGVVEGVKGKAKEAAGAVVDDDELRREGRAQQNRGESQRVAAEKEAEAQKERAKAAAEEERQRAHQHDGD